MDFDKPKVYGDTFISDGLVCLYTMTSSQVLNPLGKCEWLLFHYSPAKEELSFIPPYLNCEVQNYPNCDVGKGQKSNPTLTIYLHLKFRCSFASSAVRSGRCQL